MLKKNNPLQPKSSKIANDHYQILDISQQKVKVQRIYQQESSALPKIIEEELQLNLYQCSAETREQARYILINLLKYPSTSDAQKHRAANKLGSHDIKDVDAKVNSEYNYRSQQHKHEHCKDCGLLIQEKEIPICTSFYEFPKVGIATYLYFENIKNLSVLITLLALIYSGFALYVNITQPSEALSFTNYPSKLSYASKILNLSTNSSLEVSMNIEGWLLVGVVLIWWITFYIVKCFQIKYQRMVDDETITAADFSIMIENIPISFTKEIMQRQLLRYQQEIASNNHLFNSQKQILRPFTIKKFCKAIPFHLIEDEELERAIEQLDEEIKEKKQLFQNWIEEIRDNNIFKSNKASRLIEYEAYEKLRAARKSKLQSKSDKIRMHNNDSSDEITTTIFISFESSQSANIIESVNPQSFSAKIRYVLSCCQSACYFKVKDRGNKTVEVTVSRAPQPEDIIWNNIGFPYQSIICRKLLTYFILLLLLGASFGIVYGLTILQLNYNNSILSIAISLSITVINIVIGVAIRKLTSYEKDFTQTNRQISLSIKSIAAQLMNSILVPTITNIYIEKNLYEVNGLVYDVFYLALTNAFLPPLLKFIDGGHLVKRIIACWKLRPYQKITLKQAELNAFVEDRIFELGFSYIYFIDMFYFTCFYITMHPSIAVITFFGYFFMYWAEKYTLLYRSKRPTPSSALLSEAIGQLISFGPCVLSLGTLTWFNLLTEDYNDFSSIIYLSHLASCGLSLLFFILPFNSIFNAICHIPDDQMLDYEQSRLKLTSQYDRLNPATMEQGISDFLDYLKAHKNQANIVQNFGINKIIDQMTKKPSIQIPQKSQELEKMNKKANKEKDQPQRGKGRENMNKYSENKLEDTDIEPFNKLNESQQSLTMNEQQRNEFNDRIIKEQKEKRTIRKYAPNKMAYNRRNTDEINSKRSALFDDLKGYHTNFIKSNKKTTQSNNPYNNLTF